MGIEFSLIGLNGLNDMLERLSGDELVRAARSGLEGGLQDIRTEATENCPKVTGRLRESIKTRTRMESGTLTGEVYAGAEYAVYVEMGTGPRGEASHEGVDPERLKRTTYSPKGWRYTTKDGGVRFTEGRPARPFLYPAYKANEGNVKKKIARAVIRAARKGEGEA